MWMISIMTSVRQFQKSLHRPDLYHSARHVAAQFLLQFQEDLTATLFSLLGSSPTPAAPLHAGLRRLRCLENHSPPAPETRGPVDSSGVPFGLVRQPRSSDRYADE